MKSFEPVGVAGIVFPDAETARGFTYTTADNELVPTPLIFSDNPFNDRVDEAKVILDLGCGVGRNLPWIMENTQAHYIGLDPNPSMRDAFWQIQDHKYKDRVTLIGSFEDLPSTLKCEVVVCTFVFQHIGFRVAEHQMNISDITQEVFKHSNPNCVWILFEDDGEEPGWIEKWMLANSIDWAVYRRNYRGIPELTHRGDHHLIIFEAPE